MNCSAIATCLGSIGFIDFYDFTGILSTFEFQKLLESVMAPSEHSSGHLAMKLSHHPRCFKDWNINPVKIHNEKSCCLVMNFIYRILYLPAKSAYSSGYSFLGFVVTSTKF